MRLRLILHLVSLIFVVARSIAAFLEFNFHLARKAESALDMLLLGHRAMVCGAIRISNILECRVILVDPNIILMHRRILFLHNGVGDEDGAVLGCL